MSKTPEETRRLLLGIESPTHDIERKFFKPNWRSMKKNPLTIVKEESDE